MLFDQFGRRIAETVNGPGQIGEANIYSDWGPIAFKTAGQTYFEHQNWVGVERAHTSYNGSVAATIRSLPFGDSEADTGTVWDAHDFAMLDLDGENGTEHAQFRQYSPNQGRWLMPDPYSGSYDFNNPQSFDRYAYALNNPVSLNDPSGLYTDCGNNQNCINPLPGDPNGGGGDGNPFDPPATSLGGGDYYGPGDNVYLPPWYTFMNGSIFLNPAGWTLILNPNYNPDLPLYNSDGSLNTDPNVVDGTFVPGYSVGSIGTPQAFFSGPEIPSIVAGGPWSRNCSQWRRWQCCFSNRTWNHFFRSVCILI